MALAFFKRMMIGINTADTQWNKVNRHKSRAPRNHQRRDQLTNQQTNYRPTMRLLAVCTQLKRSAKEKHINVVLFH